MNNLYYLIYTISATSCIVVASTLLGMKSISRKRDKTFVKIKNFMALAAFIGALNCILDMVFGGVKTSEVEIFNAPVLIGLYAEILIFLGCFLSLLHSHFITKKHTFLLWLPMIVLTIAYGIVFFVGGEKRILSIEELIQNYNQPIVFIRILMVLACVVIMFIGVWMFIKDKKEYESHINNFFAANDDYKIKWASVFFYSSAPLCILILLSFIITNVVFDSIVTILIPTWFILFLIQIINFQEIIYKASYAIPENDTKLEKIAEDDFPNIFLSLKAWCKRDDKPYRQKELTIEVLSRDVDIDTKILSRYINDYCNSNFNEWINKMRLRDAILLKQDNTQSLSDDEIADITGFNDPNIMIDLIKKEMKK